MGFKKDILLKFPYLSQVHYEVPDQDDSPAYSPVNIPEPKREEESVECFVSQRRSKNKKEMPQIGRDLKNKEIKKINRVPTLIRVITIGGGGCCRPDRANYALPCNK